MMQLFINGHLMDMKGGEVIAADYSISPIADISTRDSVKSIEFVLPRTNNNLSALENPNVILNSSTLPYTLIDCYLLVDGIDMNIQKAQIISDEIRVKVFGGNITFFLLLKDQSIQDADLSSYDHLFNWTNISAALQATSGYLYPIIDYGALPVNNAIIYADSLFPSFFLHTLVEEIVTSNGYTLTGNLIDHPFYPKLILPFSNGSFKYSDEKAYSYNDAHASLPSPIAVGVGGDVAPTMTEDLDTGGNFASNKYLTNMTAAYTIRLTWNALEPLTHDGSEIRIVKQFSGGAAETLAAGELGTVIGIGGVTYTGQIEKGWYVYPQVHGGDGGCTVDALDFYIDAITEVQDAIIHLDNYWEVAPNLPDIKQSDLIKWVLQEFGAIMQVNETAKEVNITTFKKINDNQFDANNREDWSDLIDESENPIVSFDASRYAQLNECTYLDDEGVVKGDGVDYDIVINNNALQATTVLFKAPFAATNYVVKLAQKITMSRINFLSFPEDRNKLKPRILISDERTINEVTFKQNLLGGLYPISAITLGTATDVNIPYFIDLNKTFQLGWKYAIQSLCPEFIEMIRSPKQLKQLVRINPILINELDFFKPVWIEKYGSWFYKSNINQFKFTSKESTVVDLIQLPDGQ